MKKIVLMAGLLGLAVASMNALEITLESTAELALGNNRALMAQYAEQKTLDRAKKSGWNEFFPDLYVSTGFAALNNKTVDSLDLNDNWNYSVAVGGSLNISAGSAYRIGASRLAWEQGLISIEEHEHALVKESRKAFLSLLLIRDTIGIFELMVETAEARYKRAARRFELGDARKVDMLSFQVSWQNMLPQLTDLENTYEIRLLEFRRLLGIPDDEAVVLVGEITAEEETWDAVNLISSRLGKRYDVRSVQVGIQRLQNEKSLRISNGMTPTLVTELSFSPTWNDPFGNTDTYGGGLFSIGIVLPLDGFVPNTKKSLLVKEMNDQLDAAALKLADTLQAGAIDIESAVLNLNKSAQTLRSLELNVELASESYDLVSRSYDVGEADYLQVQTADDDLNTARIQLLNEKYNYSAALQDLEYAIADEIEVQALPLTPQD